MMADSAEDRTRIVLTIEEAGMVCIFIATVQSLNPGCADPECDACNATNALFWNISNAMPLSARIACQRALRETGIELPPSPWEVVATK